MNKCVDFDDIAYFDNTIDNTVSTWWNFLHFTENSDGECFSSLLSAPHQYYADGFGHSIDFSSNASWLVIGAPGYRQGECDTGAVFLVDTGDPAQEAQGLNSVFSTDKSTLDVVKTQVDRMKKIGK